MQLGFAMPWSTAFLAEEFLLEQEGGGIMMDDVSVQHSWGGQEVLLCITQLGKSHPHGH